MDAIITAVANAAPTLPERCWYRLIDAMQLLRSADDPRAGERRNDWMRRAMVLTLSVYTDAHRSGYALAQARMVAVLCAVSDHVVARDVATYQRVMVDSTRAQSGTYAATRGC
jgi:hypothetical protein